jgi:TRAP-type C4-dicarboxylate transport system permease large subunit
MNFRETAQITPPVGYNRIVIRSPTEHDILQAVRAVLPVFFLLLAGAVLLVAFAGLATWLPSQMWTRAAHTN